MSDPLRTVADREAWDAKLQADEEDAAVRDPTTPGTMSWPPHAWQHADDCGFHLDQYHWECTCGVYEAERKRWQERQEALKQ